jgi:hypothetical protein
MEVIAACGFETIAPPPGEHSFTASLIEVLENWVNVPAFSVSMLHGEVFRMVVQRRKERCSNGKYLEWRSTPSYVSNCAQPTEISFQLCKRSLLDVASFSRACLAGPIGNLLGDPGYVAPETWLDLMSLSCEALDERVAQEKQPGASLTSSDTETRDSTAPSSQDNKSCESTQDLKVPHMLVSLELDEDQQFPSVKACRRWIASYPGLVKSVKVDGVYRGYSTVLILSVPVVIWNTLPEHPACRPITYVTSTNLLKDNQSRSTNYTISMAAPDSNGSSKIGDPDPMNSRHAPVPPVDAEEEKFRPIPSDVLDDSNLQQTASDTRPKSSNSNVLGFTESNLSVVEDLASGTGSFHLSRKQKDTFSDSLPTEDQFKPLQDQLPEAPGLSIPDNTDDQSAHPPPRDIDGRLPLSLLARMDDIPGTDHKEGSVPGQCEAPTLRAHSH